MGSGILGHEMVTNSWEVWVATLQSRPRSLHAGVWFEDLQLCVRLWVATLQSRPPKVCEVWGRYAPVTAANLIEELAQKKLDTNLAKMTRPYPKNTLLQIGLKVPSLSRQPMSNSPGKCEKSQANYFLSYILRREEIAHKNIKK
jgi:hypothetical protein